MWKCRSPFTCCGWFRSPGAIFPEQKHQTLYLSRSRTCQRLSEYLKQTVRKGRWRGNRCTPRLVEPEERGYATAADELLEPVNSEWGAERWKVIWRVNERWRSWAHLAVSSLTVIIIIIIIAVVVYCTFYLLSFHFYPSVQSIHDSHTHTKEIWSEKYFPHLDS